MFNCNIRSKTHADTLVRPLSLIHITTPLDNVIENVKMSL